MVASAATWRQPCGALWAHSGIFGSYLHRSQCNLNVFQVMNYTSADFPIKVTFTMTPMMLVRLCPAIVVLFGTAACTSPPPVGENATVHDVQASPPGAAQCPSPSLAEQAAGVRATNVARTSAGLAPVRANATLAQAAAAHACDMAQRGRMTHTGTSTSGPAQRVKSLGYAPRVTAENIAAGPYNADQALAAWNAPTVAQRKPG